MRLAIMQPYIFPYIGYMQMVHAVDKFVFYDDVNFIKKGWINRNRILVNGQDYVFTVPLSKASQNNLIKDTQLHKADYDNWKSKFLQTLQTSYKKAPHYEAVNELVVSVFNQSFETISELAIESVVAVAKYLQLNTVFEVSSSAYDNRPLKKGDRLIDICHIEKADHYINAIGGQELYTKEVFKEQGIQLNFIKPKDIIYTQFKNDFQPWLSIIDVLMFNSIDEVKKLLNNYELV